MNAGVVVRSGKNPQQCWGLNEDTTRAVFLCYVCGLEAEFADVLALAGFGVDLPFLSPEELWFCVVVEDEGQEDIAAEAVVVPLGVSVADVDVCCGVGAADGDDEVVLCVEGECWADPAFPDGGEDFELRPGAGEGVCGAVHSGAGVPTPEP